METIEILLATYNGEAYIEEQIRSILNQTHFNLRLIISDDASTDGTIEIINRLQKECTIPFLVYSNKISLGPSQNFGKLLEKSKANYVMFSDQDDVWHKDKVALTYKKMKEIEAHFNGPVLVHTDLEVVDESLHPIAKSFWKYAHVFPRTTSINQILVQNVVTGCTTMINRHLVNAAIPIPKSAIMHDWWLALVASAIGKLVPLEKVTIQYRQHQKNCLGATRFGTLKHIISALKRNQILKARKREQARDILYRFGDVLNEQKREIIEKYCKIIHMNYILSSYYIFKFKYFRQGFLRNLSSLFITP